MKTTQSHLKSAFLLAACLFTAGSVGAVTVKYTNSGTFTPPAGITSVTVEIWGGGGAGGSALKTTVANAGGGGGGGGAYAKKLNVPVIPGTSYTITIPAAAVAPGANSGFATGDRVNGANVTFTAENGVTITANGGEGGQSAVNATGTFGAGGTAGAGLDGAFPGGNGSTNPNGNAGAGGSGASDLVAGNDAAGSTLGATAIGSDVDHNGGKGGSGKTGSGNGNGGAAQPGGGGGGAKASTNNTSFTGSSGGMGQILISYNGGSVVKADNSLDLNLGASWVGGNPPDATSVAVWNNTVTSANTTVLGADLTWGGITVTNPGGPVTINGGNILTLKGPIDMSAATADLTLNSDLALGGSAVWTVAASRTLTLGGVVSGAFNVTLPGDGKVVLSAANTYSGVTAISGGTVQLGASEVIPDGAGKGDVTIAAAGTLNLNGFSETINGLSGQGIVDNTAAGTTSTLTVGSTNAAITFGGVFQNSGAGSTTNLVKTGNGVLSLSGVNTLTGSVTVTGGNLTLANVNPLGSISGLTIGGAQIGFSAANSMISAPITLTGNLTAIIQNNNVLGSLNGVIGGTGNITFLTGNNTLNGNNRISIGAPATFVGDVLITTTSFTTGNNITVQLGVVNALPTTSVVTLDGALGNGNSYADLNLFGFDQTLAGLTNNPRTGRLQRVYNSGAAPATLTINNTADYTFGGTLGKAGGNDFSLVKSGAGTFTLTGANTYTGGTSVTEGALVVSGSAIPDTNSLSISGTGSVSVAGGGSETVGSLTINGNPQPDGAYTSANTGGVITSGTIQVGVAGYAQWQIANNTTQTINMDHDSDGVANGVEFFLSGPVNTTGFTPLPGVVNTGGTLSITFTKADGYGGTYGTDFFVETSPDLATWTPQTLGGNVAINGNNVKYTFPAGTIQFARLKVTGP